MISEATSGLFPHEIVREGQRELILDINQALTNNKTLIAHAPTGLGKTASALSVALKHAIKRDKVIFFLTNRHTQHAIAVETLKKINEQTNEEISCLDLIGKRWMCNQEISGIYGSDFNEFCKTVVERGECEHYNNVRTKKGPTVAAQAFVSELSKCGPLHNQQLVIKGKEKTMCSYEIAMLMAKKAKIVIGDYYYIFNPFVQSNMFTKMGLEMEDVILIVDEGHNLPNRVTEMLSSVLTTNMIKNAILEAKKFNYHGVISWLQDLMSILNNLAKFDDKNQEKLIGKREFSLKIDAIVAYDDLIAELELAAEEIRKKQRKSYLGGIATFLESWQGEDEGYTRIISEHDSKYGPIITLKYSCLDPALVTKSIFTQIDSGLIMSGTLTPTFMYKDVLGISNSLEKEYLSPFPPENKLSLVVPETSTKYNLRTGSMYQQMAEICSNVSKLIPGNSAYFFPSYYLRDQVVQLINIQKKLFLEKPKMSKEEKEQFLAEFAAARDEGGLLFGVTGANFAEGVDFPGDLLNGVVVIGLPLARPDLKTNQIIKYYEQKFGKGWDYGYIFPAMSKCIQSAGRCIRSEKDRGAIIFLDQRFSWQKYYSCLPREGLITTTDYDKYLRQFFA
tara:strand:- start:42191 stop:44050 length:1860 start_codon:yes stop_codon:yes gene_type:complete